ncbi:MAG TPA: ThiF family adenylyltransferase [Pyrinomonadaceae bacterium]|nr:ThiF family adenylyltransferase [Pyrinomonadaceae bacterium]
MKLRVLESRWTPFINALIERTDVETAGVILAERLRGGDVLFARHLIVMPEAGYTIRRADQLRLDPVALNRVIHPARDAGLSVITVHTHPHTDRPWFSAADDHGDARLMPSLFNQMPGPHGSIVIAGETAQPAGRVWSEDGRKSELETRIVGSLLRVHPSAATGEVPPWFDRQRLALGKAGQDILRHLHIVVIGLGGTGSVCFAQLAHLGVGKITVVDADRVEDSNVSRIIGATTHDAGRTFKVDVAARYAEQLGLGTQVSCLVGHLGKEVSIGDLEECDIALSCVDRHLPRALLNRLSYEAAIPLIDMGSAFRVDRDGCVVAGAGRVVISGPGRPCLACWGHIDPDRIRIESLPATERARQIKDGYIDGADVPQPSVISFNTTVAGSAVVELLRLVTGFAGTADLPMRLSFDFANGTVRRNRLPEGTGCGICLPEYATKDTINLNHGDPAPISVGMY